MATTFQNGTHIYLCTVGPMDENYTELLSTSRAINEVEYGALAAKYLGDKTVNMLSFMDCFDSEVWIAISVSLIMCGLTKAILNGSIKSTFKHIWHFAFVLLSEPIPNAWKQ